jgi:hypothetical protein
VRNRFLNYYKPECRNSLPIATEGGQVSLSRESSIFEPPEYEISYREDHTLQWDPPAGSKELAVALSYHFPMGDLESKMRAATKKFLKAEAKRYSEKVREKNVRTFEEKLESVLKTSLQRQQPTSMNSRLNPNSSESCTSVPNEPDHGLLQVPDHSLPCIRMEISPGSNQELKIVSWKPEILGFKKTAPKRRYEPEEREKVAVNRGYVCEEHRRRKMKVSTKFRSIGGTANVSSVILGNASTTDRI